MKISTIRLKFWFKHLFIMKWIALGKRIGIISHHIYQVITFHSDPNTLFRGNSMASKVIDEFMKFAGCSYLQCTLQGCIDEVSII